MSCMDRPPKKKNGPCREVIVNEGGRQFEGSTQYNMILPQLFLEFGELKIATNCTIKHSYTE